MSCQSICLSLLVLNVSQKTFLGQSRQLFITKNTDIDISGYMLILMLTSPAQLTATNLSVLSTAADWLNTLSDLLQTLNDPSLPQIVYFDLTCPSLPFYQPQSLKCWCEPEARRWLNSSSWMMRPSQLRGLTAVVLQMLLLAPHGNFPHIRELSNSPLDVFSPAGFFPGSQWWILVDLSISCLAMDCDMCLNHWPKSFMYFILSNMQTVYIYVSMLAENIIFFKTSVTQN